ncbi:MAG: ATP-binding protein [Desulfobulbaceae bacterium]|nr:ATP-binding protein [Desulfobulbaceae bacterium]
MNKIETVQTDLLVKDSPHAININVFIQHVQQMEHEVQVCTTCHHAPEITTRIESLEEDIKKYQHKLSRVYTLKADRQRLLQELDNAFAAGNQLADKVESIIAASSLTMSDEVSIANYSIADAKKILILLVTIGPFLFLLISFFFVKRFTHSLSVLTEATGKIKSGKLQFRIEEKLQDEFGQLASSFNEMSASLQEQCDLLQETERLAVVGELAAGMAHEIKNPLAGIKVSMEVLSHDLDLEQEDKEVFLQVINEIDRINALLKSLLNYARPPKPQSVFFDVHQVLDATIKSAQYSLKNPPEEDRKDIEFVRDFSPEVQGIVADPGQLQQVFLNLLLNSGDAIAEQGTITIRTRKISNETIEITFSDTGKGIDSAELDQIFKPFFTTKSHGTGLGLAICRRLIQQHSGGTITAANNPEGAGVTFTITLPVEPVNEVIAR